MKVNRSHEALPKAHSDPKEGVSFSRDSETYLSERFSQETLGQEYTECENRKPHVSGMIWSGNRASLASTACDSAGSDGNLVGHEELALQKL